MILEQLSKRHVFWYNIAKNICKDKDLAKDLVQDMYLKVYEISEKRNIEINDYYIFRVIKNLFIDFCIENNKKVSLNDFHYLEENFNKFELCDKDLKILNDLSFLERELLTLNQTMSYHEIQRVYNINYQFTRRTILKVKEKYGKKKK